MFILVIHKTFCLNMKQPLVLPSQEVHHEQDEHVKWGCNGKWFPIHWTWMCEQVASVASFAGHTQAVSIPRRPVRYTYQKKNSALSLPLHGIRDIVTKCMTIRCTITYIFPVQTYSWCFNIAFQTRYFLIEIQIFLEKIWWTLRMERCMWIMPQIKARFSRWQIPW